jgi:hypothetical protein
MGIQITTNKNHKQNFSGYLLYIFKRNSTITVLRLAVDVWFQVTPTTMTARRTHLLLDLPSAVRIAT